MDLPKQIIQLLCPFRIPEIIGNRCSDHLSNAIYPRHRLGICSADLFQIIIKRLTDHLRICNADVRDSKAVDQPRQCRISCLPDSCHQFFVGFFAKSFHLNDRIFISGEPENICKFMDKSASDKFFQSRFRHSFHIHRISADKQCKRFDFLCLTLRIGAV